jgi:hypothetical protein
MSLAVNIYGTTVQLPTPPIGEYVETWGTDNPKEQYWRRKDLPSMFEDVKFDADGAAILNADQRKYAAEEVRRCKRGFYFMNNGAVTYITGKNYFYLQWWKLEDDIYPDYRDADRRYFLFLNHWERILWCIGVARGKKRREGASSQACSNLIYECIFFTNSNCGLVSKTLQDSRDTFTDMVAFGYNQLPVFLKPKQLNKPDSVSELVFDVKPEKGVLKNTKGHRSKVNYRAPVENAYDRGRMSRVLGDEGGKWPNDVKFSKFISKVTKTMIKGAKRVGFAECPSTVNEMTKGGGMEYKKFWDGSDQFEYNNKKTPLRFVTYFTPAYDNYEGFIDKYGMSVIDAPDEETYKFLVDKWVVKDPITGETISEIDENDVKLGAKAYIFSRRDGLEGELLEEEIRQNPTTVKEMFEAANVGCLFNSYKLNQRKDLLKLHQKDLIETGNLIWKNGERDSKAEWHPNPNGRWQAVKEFLYDFMKEKSKFSNGFDKKYCEANMTEKRGGWFHPVNDWRFGCAVDPYDHDTVEDNRRSRAASIVKQKTNISNFDDKFNWCDVFKYVGRPLTAELMYEDMVIQSFFFSCRILPETQKPGIMRYFRNRGYANFLMILPGYQEPGIPSTPENKQMGCEFTEYDVEMRTDKYYFIDVIDDLLKLDIKKTQPFDLGMAKIWTEVACMNKLYERRQGDNVVDISTMFKQYKVKSA